MSYNLQIALYYVLQLGMLLRFICARVLLLIMILFFELLCFIAMLYNWRRIYV